MLEAIKNFLPFRAAENNAVLPLEGEYIVFCPSIVLDEDGNRVPCGYLGGVTNDSVELRRIQTDHREQTAERVYGKNGKLVYASFHIPMIWNMKLGEIDFTL